MGELHLQTTCFVFVLWLSIGRHVKFDARASKFFDASVKESACVKTPCVTDVNQVSPRSSEHLSLDITTTS